MLSITLLGCQKADDSRVLSKLDDIEKRLGTIEEAVKRGGMAGGMRPQMPRPDSNKVYAVPIDGAPQKGPADAKVTIVKAYEFACPFCERVRPTMDELVKEYGNDVRIVYKHYIVHPGTATTPALAACAAHKQGKFEKMYDLIWDKGFKAGRNLSEENMATLAQEAGMDASKFKADMNGEECKQKVQQDQRELAAVGTTGTPAFYINGRFLSGARPIDQFKAIVDEELKKAKERLAQGTSASEYYAKWVLEKGEKKL
jgi:protein-disulfide isomerase